MGAKENSRLTTFGLRDFLSLNAVQGMATVTQQVLETTITNTPTRMGGLTQEELDGLCSYEEGDACDSPQDRVLIDVKRIQALSPAATLLKTSPVVRSPAASPSAQKKQMAPQSPILEHLTRRQVSSGGGSVLSAPKDNTSVHNMATPSKEGLTQEVLDTLSYGVSPSPNGKQHQIQKSSPQDTELLNVKRRQALEGKNPLFSKNSPGFAAPYSQAALDQMCVNGMDSSEESVGQKPFSDEATTIMKSPMQKSPAKSPAKSPHSGGKSPSSPIRGGA